MIHCLSYDEYRTSVLDIARRMAPEYSRFCMDSVRDSFIDRLDEEAAADVVVFETAYYARDWP